MPIDKTTLERIQNDSVATEVDLSNRCLLPDDIKKLISALKNKKNILKLNLSNNNLGTKGLENLVPLFAGECYVQILDVSGNHISHTGAVFIKDILTKNRSLKELNLANNEISAKGTLAISQGLANNKNLLTLNLRGNNIKTGIDELISAIANSNLKNLNLSGNGFENKEIYKFAECLRKNASLEILDLSWNKLSSAVEEILAAINSNISSSLHTLLLNNNLICNENCIKIAEIWKTNGMHIKRLDMSNNKIKHAGASALAETLNVTSIIEFNLSGAQCNKDVFAQIKTMLQYNISSNQGKFELQRQRDRFIQTMVILARDLHNDASTSIWHRLPKDIVLLIVGFLSPALTSSLNKDKTQIESCAKFIFNNIASLNSLLKDKVGRLQIIEKRVSHNSFELRFFSPLKMIHNVKEQKSSTRKKPNPAQAEDIQQAKRLKK